MKIILHMCLAHLGAALAICSLAFVVHYSSYGDLPKLEQPQNIHRTRMFKP